MPSFSLKNQRNSSDHFLIIKVDGHFCPQPITMYMYNAVRVKQANIRKVPCNLQAVHSNQEHIFLHLVLVSME